jgi:hypothetical protein
MHQKIQSLFFILMLSLSVADVNAQGWCQDKPAIYSLGLGGSQVLFLPAQYYVLAGRGSLALSMNVAGEYRVHRLIGIGWQTGLDVFAAGYYLNRHDGLYYSSAVVGLPIGFKFNFHILEATHAEIKRNLDVYAGFNVGGGPAIYTGPGAGLYGFIYAGPQIGVRYWFDKIALFGELGWGATFANIGITFR